MDTIIDHYDSRRVKNGHISETPHKTQIIDSPKNKSHRDHEDEVVSVTDCHLQAINEDIRIGLKKWLDSVFSENTFFDQLGI